MTGNPLLWPVAVHRCNDRSSPRTRVSIAGAVTHLLTELEKIGAIRVTITSDARLKANGLPYSDGQQPHSVADPGVAVWFSLPGQPGVYCLCCDQVDSIGGNLREIGLAVAELRGVCRRLRVRVSVLLTPFWSTEFPKTERPQQPKKEPAPTQTKKNATPPKPEPVRAKPAPPPPAPPPKPEKPPFPPGTWQHEFGFRQGQVVTYSLVVDTFRELAKQRHPDKGGSNEAMMRLNQAMDEAKIHFNFKKK